MVKYIPIGKKVVVKPVPKESKTSSGILLKEEIQKQKGEGTIIAIGAEVKKLKVGDRILFSPLYYDEIDEENFVLNEEDVWAVIK